MDINYRHNIIKKLDKTTEKENKFLTAEVQIHHLKHSYRTLFSLSIHYGMITHVLNSIIMIYCTCTMKVESLKSNSKVYFTYL